jgi:hypothetical protein
MATYNKFQQFAEDVMEKVHNLGSDQLTFALTHSTNPPVATNSVLANLTEITYTNLSTRNITTTSSAHTSGTYKLTLTDLVISASGGAANPFQYLCVYNSTAAGGPLIAWYNYGSDLTLNDGESLTVDFDDANGFFQFV